MTTPTDLTDREARLRQELDAPEATNWRPDVEGSTDPALLMGELVGMTSGNTTWQGQQRTHQIAIVKDTTGKLWKVWLIRKVLADEFARQQPAIGEFMAIRWEGMVSPPGGATYAKYTVRVDRRGQTHLWHGAADDKPGPSSPAPPPPPAEPEPAPLPPAARVEEPAPLPAMPVAASVCERCEGTNGRHYPGCANDIPF